MPKSGLILLALLAAGMWCYADLILVPHEVADGARTGRPRGNLSDLYPRWLAARELLLHGRDPYSPEITREIQAGYYGRPLDSSRPNDPKDQQGFAYPVYVVFFLAPTIHLPFRPVQIAFRWLLILLIAGSVPLWLSALRWRISTTATLMTIVAVLGTFPAVQVIKLQQLSALVCVLLAACAASLAGGRLLLAGVLLALATIKPQLAIPFAAWLAIWVTGDWRSRRRLLWSFVGALAILVLGGEIVLPGWLARFRDASAAYLQYAGGTSLLDLSLTPTWGRVIALLLMIAMTLWCWRQRRAPADSEAFRWTMVSVLTAILCVIPTFAPYNQLLLIPAALMLVRRAPRIRQDEPLLRVSLLLSATGVVLPWLAAAALDIMLLVLPHTMVERAWAVPLWTSWAIPFPILAAVALCSAAVIRETRTTAAV